MNYYNEIDPYAAQWLRNLIAAGEIPNGVVDERDIRDILPEELGEYTQCHFFAGIGGWPLALRMSGWPDSRPVWSGSCPCQRFSSAARGRNNASDLWPAFRRLISASRPTMVFGEQVASAKLWFDGVCDDLEALDYTVGAAVLPACSVGHDHRRERIYFAGHAHGNRQPVVPVNAKMARVSRGGSDAGAVAGAHGVSARVGRLRAYGNAIVPQVAAAFVSAVMCSHPGCIALAPCPVHRHEEPCPPKPSSPPAAFSLPFGDDGLERGRGKSTKELDQASPTSS